MTRASLLGGRAVSLVALGIVVLLFLVGRHSVPAFAILAGAALLLTSYAAHRWPRATIVAAALVTLADPAVTPRIIPSELTLGPIGASEPLLAVAGAVIVVTALRRGTFAQAFRDPVFLLIGLFLAVSILSALVNATPPLVAAFGIFMTVDAIAMYFVWRMLPSDLGTAARAIGAVVGVALVASLFGIGQVLLDPNLLGFAVFEGRFGEGGRITSFMGNPNMLSPLIGFALPFPLFGAVRLQRPRQRWIAGAVAFVLLLALVLTFSRGAWIAVGLGTVLGALLLDRRALLVLVVLVLLASVSAVYLPRNLAVDRDGGEGPPPPDLIDTTFDRFEHLGEEADNRARFLRDGLRIIHDHLLLGVGPGRYGGAAATIIPSPVYEEYDTDLAGFRTVHNFWLHLAGEVGAIGLAVFLTVVFSLLIRYLRAAWRVEGLAFILLAGTATATLVIGLNNVTEMGLEGNVPAVVMWLILAVGSTLAPSAALRSRRPAAAPDA